MEEIFLQTRDAAYRIILITDYYGMSDVFFSLPAVIDRGGVEQVLRLELSPEEIEKLRHSAGMLKAVIGKLDLK